MKKRLAACTIAIVALVWVGMLSAHHSISLFEIATPVWVKGTVISYQPVNPHALFQLEERSEDGLVRLWTVEGPALQRLARMNVGPDFIEAGDVIEVCGFAPKAELDTRPPSPEFPGYPRQFLHGHLLLMPDGQMRTWGSYGKLENCIRPEDQPDKWLNFLDSDPMGRAAWCATRRFVRVASVAPEGFVDEVDNRMSDPCE